MPLTDPQGAVNQYMEVAMKQTTEHHASTTALPIYVHRVAWELGYVEVNSFYRASRRWTGHNYSDLKQLYV